MFIGSIPGSPYRCFEHQTLAVGEAPKRRRSGPAALPLGYELLTRAPAQDNDAGEVEPPKQRLSRFSGRAFVPKGSSPPFEECFSLMNCRRIIRAFPLGEIFPGYGAGVLTAD